MKIAVLDLCVWLQEYQYDQDRFGELLVAWLKPGLPEARFTVLRIVDGEALPDPADFDGYVLSGSEKGVYDAAPWMDGLRQFLLAARDAGKPLFGVCFGHQIMADVFGGKAEKVGGQEVGVRSFALDGAPARGHVWHQDQVTKVPPGARVIGAADYCPVAALAYDFPALSVQFHPEYSAAYVSTFLGRSRGDVLPEAAADAAINDLAASDVRADLFVAQTAQFFRDALG